MRVLQVTPRYPPNWGGVEIVVQKLSELLAENGIEVVVYSVDLCELLPSYQKVNGVTIKRFAPIFGDPLFLPEFKFTTRMRREKADLIHVHNIHISTPLLVSALRHKRQKLVVQPHYHRFGQSAFRNCLLRLYTRLADTFVFRQADMTIANSIYEKTILQEDFRSCRNIELVPEGLELAEIARIKRNPVSPARILHVGALKGYKNVDKVLDGFAWLVRKETLESLKLVIVGNGPQRDSLIARARALRIDSMVEWKSGLTRQQILDEYSNARVLVLLSSLESFSRVVHEALLAGVPTVVLNYGALASLVSAQIAEGVESLNAQQVAQALLRALARKTSRAQSNPTTFLDWKEYAKRIIEIYSKVLEQ